jgi:hypothetical protein
MSRRQTTEITRLRRGRKNRSCQSDNLSDKLQAISNNGGCLDAVAERSKGVPGLITRWAEHGTIGGQKLIYIAMTASQMRIAETIDAFYGDAGAKDGVSRSYKQAVEDLDAETIKALDGPYRYARRVLY